MKIILSISVIFCLTILPSRAEVVASADAGFQIEISEPLSVDANRAFEHLTQDIGKWWNSDHTYSGDARNLSMSLEEKCLLEKLPKGGFVRHLEVVNFQPGKLVTLTGGLGPLQPMGVNGALTFSFTKSEDESVRLEVAYNVHGFAKDGFKSLAPAVDSVLAEQVKRFKKFCESKQ